MRPVTALLLLVCCSPALANREGWANARQKAERLERRGELADATVWWEAAAETLEVVSAPLSELGMAEAKEDGDEGSFAWWKEYGEEDKKLAAEARDRAKACAAKAGKIPEETRASVRQFIDGWIVQDPEQYWNWGQFEIRMASRRAAGDPVGALELEAKARSRWAGRYTKICVPYWKTRGNEKKVAEYTNRAAEQEKLSREALDRATDTAKKDGWEPEALVKALRSGTPEEQRAAVERLATRGDVANLRVALECADEKGLGLAVAALVRMNDLPTLAISRDSKAAKAVQEELKCAEAAGSPEFHVALLAGLSSDKAGVRDACAGVLSRVLGGVPEGDPAALRGHFEDALEKLCQPGVGVEVHPSSNATDRAEGQTWEDIDREWGRDAPVKGFPADGWWLRASGFLVMKDEATVELLVQCDDAIRVRIDGRAVIDEWADAPEPLYRRAPLHLSKGWHSLVLEYGDRSGVATLRAWLAPGRDEVEPLAGHLRRPVQR